MTPHTRHRHLDLSPVADDRGKVYDLIASEWGDSAPAAVLGRAADIPPLLAAGAAGGLILAVLEKNRVKIAVLTARPLFSLLDRATQTAIFAVADAFEEGPDAIIGGRLLVIVVEGSA
jgi:hypothetical protein